jgi:FtsP/CotA-like multicopper oxidase with cupredoxin domain
MQRRDFIKAAAASGAFLASGWPTKGFSATPSFQITTSKTAYPIGGPDAPKSDLWLYNQACPGPMLRLQQGDILRAKVINQLDVPTTIHWHGIRILNEMDGVANLTQAPIEPGETFLYEFPVNHAGTYWYHAHNMSWEQVERGLYGPLIIDFDDDPETDHDICLMLDDWRLDKDGLFHAESLGSLHDWSHGGRFGNWLTVNAQSDPVYKVKPNSRVRLRLINAANARVLKIRLSGGESQLIALDGASCPAEALTEITLAPAQRADFICDLTTATLVVEETSTGESYPAGRLLATTELGPATAAKSIIKTTVPPLPPLADAIRIPIHMQGGAMGNLASAQFEGAELSLRELAQKHKKLWAFNGKVGDYSNVSYEIKRGSLVSIDVYNDTAWPHAMHLHGHHFWVMSDNPTADLPSGQRDTWLMQPQEKASLVFLADNPGLWLFHCHMLEHAASGMGPVFWID